MTEGKLYNIIWHALTEAINELTINQASVGGVYNALSMNDINNGKEVVTFGRGHKTSIDRLEKSNEIEWHLLSKAIHDSMGNFCLRFVQPDGGIGNKVITLRFDSVLYVGNNGFILYGEGKVSGKRLVRGKFVPDFRKIKIFYDAATKTYFWFNTYKVNDEKYIRIIGRNRLMLPKGDAAELLENRTNEEQLFANINSYIDTINSNLPVNLQLKLRL